MNLIQIEFWQAVGGAFTLIVMFGGVAWTTGTILVRQFKAHLDSKLETMEAARAAADQALQHELARHAQEEGKAIEKLERLEREFQNLRAEMPLNYVRREDDIRRQSVIEAKLDALFGEVKSSSKGGNQ